MPENKVNDELLSVLYQIEALKHRFLPARNGKRVPWDATMKNIWQGCYDVCHDREDEKRIYQEKLAHMQRVVDAGLIEKYEGTRTLDCGLPYTVELWRLTEKGKTMIQTNNYSHLTLPVRKIVVMLTDGTDDITIYTEFPSSYTKEFGGDQPLTINFKATKDTGENYVKTVFGLTPEILDTRSKSEYKFGESHRAAQRYVDKMNDEKTPD